MSPEQARAQHDVIGPETDIYGLGVLFFEMLTGSLPFRGPTVVVLSQIATQLPPRPTSLRADVDPELETLCLKMLAKKGQDRPKSMTQVVQILTNWLQMERAPPNAPANDSNAMATAQPEDALSTAKLVAVNVEKIESQKQDCERLPEIRAVEQQAREVSAPPCRFAEQLHQRHDYAGMVELLTLVPPAHRSVELRDQLARATNLRDECEQLQRAIEEAVRSGNTESLSVLANLLFKLQPNSMDNNQLLDDLQEFGAKEAVARRRRQRRLVDFYDRLFETKQIVGSIIVVVGLLVVASLVVQKHLANSPPSGPIDRAAIVESTPSAEPVVVAEVRPPREFENIEAIPPNEANPKEVGSPADQPSERSPLMESEAPLGSAKLPLEAADEPSTKPIDLPPETITSPSTGMKLVSVPAGKFQMGADGSYGGRADEYPQHTVRISQFYMGLHEVTQGEFTKIMARNPSRFKSNFEKDSTQFPVEQVTWFDAVEFLNQLSVADGFTPRYRITGIQRNSDAIIKVASVEIISPTGYRLPTEAEWEYACRANTATPFHFGSVVNGDLANVNGKYDYLYKPNKWNDLERTTTVGSYAPNAFGLFDMHGNVWEWCFDVYDRSAYRRPTVTTDDPLTTTGSQFRVLRGGSWNNNVTFTRAAGRFRLTPGDRDDLIGFRVVR